MLRLLDFHQPLKYLGLPGSGPFSGIPLLLSPPGCLSSTGTMGEEPQLSDKDTKATMGTEDTPGGKVSPDSQDLRPSVFHSIKVRLEAR